MSTKDPSIFVATSCYGGLAHAAYARSLLALKAACAARRVGLHVELGGGEALSGRGRAAMMAKFLSGAATHLLFVDNDAGFSPEALFRLLGSGRDVTALDAGSLLISRNAARRMADAHPELLAKLSDLQASSAATAAMVFDPLTDPTTGRYLTDLEAFRQRWRRLDSEPAEGDEHD